MAAEDAKKRKLNQLSSPEKLSQAASISEGLLKLNKGLLEEDDTDDLVSQIKEVVGISFMMNTLIG